VEHNPAAECRNVVKVYPAKQFGRRWLRAVDGVSLRFPSGQTTGLIGPNQAGKTTLIKLLLSLCQPTRGRVWRFGRPGTERWTLAATGYMPEVSALPEHQTARNVLELFGLLSGLTRPVLKHRVPDLLDRVGLADRASAPIGQFSKGMFLRLDLAHAFINDPSLLILDEPFEGLDGDGQRLAVELIAEHRARGASVVLATHQWPTMQTLCDRVAALVAGRLVFEGPIHAITQTTGLGFEPQGDDGEHPGNRNCSAKALGTISVPQSIAVGLGD